MQKLCIFLWLFVASASTEAATRLETRLAGNWCASSNTAFYEEFTLEIEGEKRNFRSYLHHRPGESGDWRIENKQLVITTFNTDNKYKIVKLTRNSLVLKNDAGRKEPYKRCK